MQYEFGSTEWLAALHGIIAERTAALSPGNPKLWMSTCEVFYNAPAHLAGPDGKISWSCVIADGKADFQRKERDDVRYKVLCDYNAVLPMAQYDTLDDADRQVVLQQMVKELLDSGNMSRPLGARSADPDHFPKLHDAIAKLTI
ncbi:hypothetical protein [Phenylobacterium sp.]|uniref:hypothetical protein n=1 Tax=Phenylobacterium sp. TaxID=1871053 RepID=UPI0025F71B73|nr:hypothetical protein [Phenylobacterium sp.]MBX3482011.1 hypothetical protein [Phenylobacterium sp.]